MTTCLEIARWIEAPPAPNLAASRVYVGHETCERRLPSPAVLARILEAVAAQGRALTLVTPFLSDRGIESVRQLLTVALDTVGSFELVCNDWGMLAVAAQTQGCEPLLGRLLVGQRTDPRLARLLASDSTGERPVQHLDGTVCRLRKRPAPPALRRHLQAPPVSWPAASADLRELGVRRLELSNPLHGLALPDDSWRYSLYLPDVLVSVMRHCPGDGERFDQTPRSCRASCAGMAVPWRLPSFPVPLCRRDNALTYEHSVLPEDLAALPIDRLVWHSR